MVDNNSEGIKVFFPGGKKVEARTGNFSLMTDQPASNGGEGSAPSPFDLFLSSLATCAGYFIKSFLDSRELSSDGISITQKVQWGENGLEKILIHVEVPENFPEKYHKALIKAANQCSVKRVLASPPEIEVTAG
ncbi:MAG: osmotically inducible protein OsmC [Candidatus Wallbacteria bacterium HGW-Wallbacteria-1]|uniref:Osmotically inducible protein OsmC n=1 Tax=Candidatus Wallbacteria bacterium HGW-Wallbacteria-1 TaxID=2013854 RepID=A0A2N1PME3_9BACT|nr:MAG: osmotically inducible protein OsmC [Candidatus Wallbacteria bacterium HGW-Wallbacteria-1]